MSGRRYDAVIIGGGHNGLVCAFYLARAGMKVRVLERRHIVGGAAVTEEFHPGFRNSTASYTVSLLNPKVIADMRLAERGLRIVERPISNFLPQPDGGYLKLGGGLARTQAEFASFSARDAEALPAYYDALDGVADVLRELALKTPPNARRRPALAARRRGPGPAAGPPALERQRDLLDLFAKSARDLPRRLVRERGGQGRVRLRRRRRQLRQPRHARLGLCPAAPRVRRGERQEGRLGPRHRRHGRDHPGHGGRLRRRQGVEITLEAPVAAVLVEGGAAAGVRLECGRGARRRPRGRQRRPAASSTSG